MHLKPFGFLLVFVVPALMPFSAWLAAVSGAPNAAAWFPLLFLFVLLPLADYALGRDLRNPRDAADIVKLEGQHYYRLLTLLAAAVQIVLIAWSGWWFVHAELGAVGILGWLASQGVVSGILGINVAHELIHKRERVDQWAGGALLCSVGYFGFKIEHVRGHHVNVSTPLDASSARFGQSVYPFMLRSLASNITAAWRLEAQRLTGQGVHWLNWRNEMLWWTTLWAAFGAAMLIWLGPPGLAFFLIQGLGAALSLEIINYIEHYGLTRRQVEGRYERTTHQHSWNSSYLLSNLLLFQLQRHSDHHANPRRRYQALIHHDDSPQLPGGYSAMFVLALLPPLWRRIIDPRVEAFYGGAGG